MRREELRLLVEQRWPVAPVASTRQLAAAGLEDQTLTSAVRDAVLVRVRRGAYVQTSQWNLAKHWERDSLRIQAHYESTGGTACYSHTSAARLHSFGIHGFQPQYELPTRSGLFRADFADPSLRVIIEFDGKAKYSDFNPTDQVLLAERSRENALAEAGWIFLRVDWKQLDAPMQLRRRVLVTLARAEVQKRPRPA